MSISNKNILIASSTISGDEYTPVVDILTDRGHEVAVYNSDLVLDGTDKLVVNVTEEGEVAVNYNSRDISNDIIDALWYRKVADFHRPGETEDKAKALLIQDEVASFHQDIWTSLYDPANWLNSPEKIQEASNKLGQLLVARQLGFSIPETLVSSDWDSINHRLFDEKGFREIIVKMVRGVIIQDGKDMAMPTTILSKERADLLSGTTTSFPGIYQPYKQKFREWRVTVVGEEVFPIAIYTEEGAKDDWRRHQARSEVMFASEPFDPVLSERCVEFLGSYGLRFGAFDFIESDSGQTTFLECNANGQYFRFEEEFGLPISEAIANELIRVANQ